MRISDWSSDVCSSDLFRLVLRNPNATTIVQNPDDRDTLLLLKAVRPEQVTLIRGSGVDCDRFHPTPEPPGVPVVVFASRMIWDKGVGEVVQAARIARRSEEHTSELQSLMRISYAVFCLKKKRKIKTAR